MAKTITFKEFVIRREYNDAWGAVGTHPLPYDSNTPLKHLEDKVYKLINYYRDYLVKASREGGEEDDDIHHDLIKKDDKHKSILSSIAELFSRVHDIEKGSPKLKPSFFSDSAFERIARYAKRKLGYHADDIGDYLKKINPLSVDDLYHIWTPGSWATA